MASGFEVVRLELAFGRKKLDEWLISELNREQYEKLSIYQPKKGKAQTVDTLLSSVEAAAEKRGAADEEDAEVEEDEDGDLVVNDFGDSKLPYDQFKMKIFGDKMSASGRLAGDEKLAEAFVLAALVAKAGEMGGKGELILLGAKGADGAEKNLKIVASKTGWSEVALSAAEAAALR